MTVEKGICSAFYTASLVGGGGGGCLNSSVLDALKDVSSWQLIAQLPANVSCWGYNCTQPTVITQITRGSLGPVLFFLGSPYIPSLSVTLDTQQTVSQPPFAEQVWQK
jgi:hypothetical protein